MAVTHLTRRQSEELSIAIRHIGRAMRALDRAKLLATNPSPSHPEPGEWDINRGARTLCEASDQLIRGAMAAAGHIEDDDPYEENP